MIPFLLWLLATIDSACIGFREAGGRSALIDKTAYYRRALIKGALFGQLAVLIVGVITAGLLLVSSDPLAQFQDLERVGSRMLLVYIPYALIILITMCIRAVPSVDIRSITSTLVFGPFTLIRPLVVLAGAFWGVLAAPNAITIVLTIMIVSLMLGLEWILGLLRSRQLIS